MRKFGALRELIKLKYGTQKAFAEAMGMNVTTLNLKLNDKTVWTVPEIEKACKLLNFSTSEIATYFFY